MAELSDRAIVLPYTISFAFSTLVTSTCVHVDPNMPVAHIKATCVLQWGQHACCIHIKSRVACMVHVEASNRQVKCMFHVRSMTYLMHV